MGIITILYLIFYIKCLPLLENLDFKDKTNPPNNIIKIPKYSSNPENIHINLSKLNIYPDEGKRNKFRFLSNIFSFSQKNNSEEIKEIEKILYHNIIINSNLSNSIEIFYNFLHNQVYFSNIKTQEIIKKKLIYESNYLLKNNKIKHGFTSEIHNLNSKEIEEYLNINKFSSRSNHDLSSGNRNNLENYMFYSSLLKKNINNKNDFMLDSEQLDYTMINKSNIPMLLYRSLFHLNSELQKDKSEHSHLLINKKLTSEEIETEIFKQKLIYYKALLNEKHFGYDKIINKFIHLNSLKSYANNIIPENEEIKFILKDNINLEHQPIVVNNINNINFNHNVSSDYENDNYNQFGSDGENIRIINKNNFCSSRKNLIDNIKENKKKIYQSKSIINKINLKNTLVKKNPKKVSFKNERVYNENNNTQGQICEDDYLFYKKSNTNFNCVNNPLDSQIIYNQSNNNNFEIKNIVQKKIEKNFFEDKKNKQNFFEEKFFFNKYSISPKKRGNEEFCNINNPIKLKCLKSLKNFDEEVLYRNEYLKKKNKCISPSILDIFLKNKLQKLHTEKLPDFNLNELSLENSFTEKDNNIPSIPIEINHNNNSIICDPGDSNRQSHLKQKKNIYEQKYLNIKKKNFLKLKKIKSVNSKNLQTEKYCNENFLNVNEVDLFEYDRSRKNCLLKYEFNAKNSTNKKNSTNSLKTNKIIINDQPIMIFPPEGLNNLKKENKILTGKIKKGENIKNKIITKSKTQNAEFSESEEKKTFDNFEYLKQKSLNNNLKKNNFFSPTKNQIYGEKILLKGKLLELKKLQDSQNLIKMSFFNSKSKTNVNNEKNYFQPGKYYDYLQDSKYNNFKIDESINEDINIKNHNEK